MVSFDRRPITAVSLAVALTLSLSIAAQQTLGAINGTVADSSGSLIPGVTVTAVDEATQLSRTIVSNSTGVYFFVNLLIGSYNLSFQRDGFNTGRFPGICVQADPPSRCTRSWP